MLVLDTSAKFRARIFTLAISRCNSPYSWARQVILTTERPAYLTTNSVVNGLIGQLLLGSKMSFLKRKRCGMVGWCKFANS